MSATYTTKCCDWSFLTSGKMPHVEIFPVVFLAAATSIVEYFLFLVIIATALGRLIVSVPVSCCAERGNIAPLFAGIFVSAFDMTTNDGHFNGSGSLSRVNLLPEYIAGEWLFAKSTRHSTLCRSTWFRPSGQCRPYGKDRRPSGQAARIVFHYRSKRA